MTHYTITEEDINGMVRYLSIYHPENANQDYAVELLEYMKAAYQHLAFSDPELLNELYAAFENSKK